MKLDGGQRPDGFSLHLTEDDRSKYCKEYWDNMPPTPPPEYSKEDGRPFLLDVNEKTYKKLMDLKKEGKYGLRTFERSLHNFQASEE